VRLHQAGQLDQALALYRRILKAEPRHADTLHLCGLALLQSGDAAGAVRPLERAVKVQGDRAPYHLNLAEAYRIGRDFLSGAPSSLILGDNLFFGQDLSQRLEQAHQSGQAATVFAYPVSDPERYGVVEMSPDNQVLSLEEKPEHPKSNLAVPGLYFFDGSAPERTAQLHPSARGELEIVDLMRRYLEDGSLTVELMGRGFAWLDTGTHESLAEAGAFVQAIEQRQGLKIGAPEEVAFRLGLIDADHLLRLATPLLKTRYGRYLQQICTEKTVAHQVSNDRMQKKYNHR